MNKFDHFGGIVAFVTVARTGSFTAAAEKLGITKSAVGKSVSRLEEKLDMQLFNRTTRKVVLTEDGVSYFVVCSKSLDEISGVESALSSNRKTLIGNLRIDVPVSFGRKVMLPILLDFAKIHSKLNLAISFADHLVDPISESIDLIIRFGDLKNSEGLIARKLSTQPLVTCASPQYLKKHGVPKKLEELSDHALIVGFRNGGPLRMDFGKGSSSRRIQAARALELGDGDAIVGAAKAGFGICQMPISIVRNEINEGELITLFEKEAQPTVDVYALWPQTSHLSPKTRRLVDHLVRASKTGHLD